MEKIAGVYMFQNPETYESYIGSSVDLKTRIATHVRELQRGTHPNPLFQRAYNKNPNFEVVAMPLEDRETALDAEQAFLDDSFGNPLLLNIARDARHCSAGLPHREETKQKISQKLQGRTPPAHVLQAAREASIGRVVSESEREQRSEAAKRLMSDPARRAAVGEFHRGRQRSDETRQRISQGQLGHTLSQESRQKIIDKNSKAVSVNGIVYPSGKVAAQQLGIAPSTITKRVNSTEEQYSTWVKL